MAEGSFDPTFDPTTTDPTFDPTTFDPTYFPTFFPSFDPTYDPTFNPTNDQKVVETISISGYITPVFFFLSLAIASLIFYYAEKGFPWHTYITCFVGYFAAFAVLLIVPLDVGAIVVNRRSTTDYEDASYNYNQDHLTALYTVLYLIIQGFCGFIMSFEEYYNTDGYFTIGSKCVNSLIRMIVFMLPFMVVGGIMLGVFISQRILDPDLQSLLLIMVLVTNFLYEFGLMFLMGYGLVQFPRMLWDIADIDGTLLRAQANASARFKDLSESSLNVSEVVSDVLKTKEQLIGYGDPALIQAIEIIISESPAEFKSSSIGKAAVNKKGKVTIDTLATLRERLNWAKDRYRMALGQLEVIKRKAYTIEDIALAKNTEGKSTIFWTLYNKESSRREYNWHVSTKPLLYKIAAGICGMLSILSYLGVLGSMKGINPHVSLYFMAVHNDEATGPAIVIFILLTLGYAVYVTYWALSEVRFAGLMELVPYLTTPESLSFNGRWVARLASPLGFFYLGWLYENGTKNGEWLNNRGTVAPVKMISSFANFYRIQVLPVFGDTFGTVFPSILLVVSFLVLTNIFNRLFVLCGLPGMQFGQEIVTPAQLKEGKRLLERHKKSTARTIQRGTLKERLGELAKSDRTGVFSYFWGKPQPKPDDAIVHEEAEVGIPLQEPPSLAGAVERKGERNSFGLEKGWKEEYAAVSPPGVLCFYKNESKVASGPDFRVDLRQITSFKDVPLGNRGYSLELGLPDSVVKLRFKTEADQANWKVGLIMWKDYAADFYGGERFAASSPLGEETVSPMQTQLAMQPPSERSTGIAAMLSASTAKAAAAEKKRDSVSNQTTELLNAVEIGGFTDPPVDESSSTSSSGLLAKFALSPKKGASKTTTAVSTFAGSVEEPSPNALEGWLEKKHHSPIGFGGGWERKYCVVDERTATLQFFKNQSRTGNPSGSIDLKSIAEIVEYQDKKDPSGPAVRFNIKLDEKVYKMRATSVSEKERWMSGLHEWSDYFLMHHV